MTEPNPMHLEARRVYNSLIFTAAKTKDEIDARMRNTVKDLLDYHYALEGEEIEDVEGRKAHMQAFLISSQIADKLLGVDSSNHRQTYKNAVNWNHERPRRISDYVQKIADIVPAENLTKLIRDCQRLTAEKLISRYEAVKGEAKLSDYSGQPTGIDSNAFRYIAKIISIK
jgi:hypothetical protein